jgi:hypothetical protein
LEIQPELSRRTSTNNPKVKKVNIISTIIPFI